MAELLYRLGRFSAHRPWTVLVAWLAALALAVGGFLAFGGTLTSSMSIPGTETERVNEQLSDELSGLGGATGTVVFQTEDGTALTAAQQEEITALLADIGELDGVSDVVDPFAAASTRTDQAQQLDAGQAQVDDAAEQLDAGQAQIDAARQQLDAGQTQLDAAIAQAQDTGTYDQAAAQFAAQQAQLDAGAAELAAQQAQLDAGAAELMSQATQLDDARRLMHAASEIRTVSSDESTALGAVMFEDDLFSLSTEVKASVADELDNADIDGVTIDYSSTIAASIEGLIGVGEIVGVLVAALVLIIMLGALLPRDAADHHVAHRRRRRRRRLARLLGRRRHVVGHARARRDARPRGRHRLRAVHRQPAPPPAARTGMRAARVHRARRTAPRATRSSSPAPPCSSPCSRST